MATLTLTPELETPSRDVTRARPLLIALAVAILVAVFPIIPGLIGALVLYVCTLPAYRWFAGRVPARWAAFGLTFAAFLVIVIPGSWLVSAVVAEGADALGRLQSSGAMAALARARIGGVSIATQVANLAASLLSWVSGQALVFVGSATRGALNLVVALYGLYYLLGAGPRLWRRFEHLLPFPPDISEHLRSRFAAVTEAMLLGTILTAALQGIIVGLAFALVGFPGAVLWGVVTAGVSVLPVMGSAFVWLPGTAVLLFEHRFGAAAVLGVIGAVVASNLDNLVRLVVYKRVSDVHPMITLVGAFAGVGVFGLAGVLIGPLTLLYFFELLGAYEHTTSKAVPAAEWDGIGS